MMVLLVGVGEGELSLRADVACNLARLGVTNLALVRDDQTVGVVLEGWAFDPARSGTAALAALAGTESEARVLHPLLHMAVSAASAE